MSDKILLLNLFNEMLAREREGIKLHHGIIKESKQLKSIPTGFTETIETISTDEKKHIAYLDTILDKIEKLP